MSPTASANEMESAAADLSTFTRGIRQLAGQLGRLVVASIKRIDESFKRAADHLAEMYRFRRLQ
jgi:hypothetical protein